MLTGREVRLRAYPNGPVGPEHFAVVDVAVREPVEGEVLVRNTWTSVDPGLRLRLRDASPDGYFAAFPLDASMDGIMTIGEVVESNVDGFAAGDTVWHALGWRDYSVVAAADSQLNGLGTLTRLDVEDTPPQWYLGPLGGMGLTAFAGLTRVDAFAGKETIWVSAAAGAVGSLAAQFAKLAGNQVIGSAGSAAKVAYLREELGLAAAFSHRSAPVSESLRACAPDGLDIYFDNVGGDHLEAALGQLRRRGRIALCGSVGGYEAVAPSPGPANLFQAVSMDLTLCGFRGSSHLDLLPQMQREVKGWLDRGLLHVPETVVEGLERAPEALARMLRGDTTGKTLVRLA